jgi:uncharacterized protein YegP (UPF0339 family)
MATATKKTRAARDIARRAVVSTSASMEFRVVETNGGRYRWMILDASGESLAQSGSFASYDDAANAARYLRNGAGSARFERRAAAAGPVDIVARRAAAMARDDSDAERWLDEGGSFSSEAVATCRPGR